MRETLHLLGRVSWINVCILELSIPCYCCFVGAGLNKLVVESLGLSRYSNALIYTSSDSSAARCVEILISFPNCLLSRDCALPGMRLSESLLEVTVDVGISLSEAEPEELKVSQCKTKASQNTTHC
jgi:hypothetical protein